jgi:hypothetical protein
MVPACALANEVRRGNHYDCGNFHHGLLLINVIPVLDYAKALQTKTNGRDVV